MKAKLNIKNRDKYSSKILDINQKGQIIDFKYVFKREGIDYYAVDDLKISISNTFPETELEFIGGKNIQK